MIQSGPQHNLCVCLAGLERTPRTEGNVYSVSMFTSQITISLQLGALHALRRNMAQTEYTA